MPEDILSNATYILTYFLPFTKDVGENNADGVVASQEWADIYNKTNAIIGEINIQLKELIEAAGSNAAIAPGGFDTDSLVSTWSVRHIAEAAGLGTFGVNNMLITEVGSMGRFGSVVTSLRKEDVADGVVEGEIVEGKIVEERISYKKIERCLYKSQKKCLACVKRCPTGALTAESFDRKKCYESCLVGERERGADVCGKCAVMIPCAIIE